MVYRHAVERLYGGSVQHFDFIDEPDLARFLNLLDELGRSGREELYRQLIEKPPRQGPPWPTYDSRGLEGW